MIVLVDIQSYHSTPQTHKLVSVTSVDAHLKRSRRHSL